MDEEGRRVVEQQQQQQQQHHHHHHHHYHCYHTLQVSPQRKGMLALRVDLLGSGEGSPSSPRMAVPCSTLNSIVPLVPLD